MKIGRWSWDSHKQRYNYKQQLNKKRKDSGKWSEQIFVLVDWSLNLIIRHKKRDCPLTHRSKMRYFIQSFNQYSVLTQIPHFIIWNEISKCQHFPFGYYDTNKNPFPFPYKLSIWLISPCSRFQLGPPVFPVEVSCFIRGEDESIDFPELVSILKLWVLCISPNFTDGDDFSFTFSTSVIVFFTNSSGSLYFEPCHSSSSMSFL